LIKSIVIIFIFLISLSANSKSTNIAVINVEEIINNNNSYKSILQKIENNQKSYLDEFRNEENKIETLLNEIENSKLILSENEINQMISKYNNDLKNFTNKVDRFNLHYQNQILNIRKFILEEIIVLTEKYANDYQFDIILDSTNYLIASNRINITDIIKKELKKIELNLTFEDFNGN